MKSLLPIALLVFFYGFSNAQTDTRPSEAPVAETPSPIENSLLWEISGGDLEKPSYLYGTIHMIGKEDFFLTEDTKQAFGESEQVTFEINMDDMNNIGVMLSLIGQVMMDGGARLSDLISEEDYKMVKDHFSKLGLPMMLFEKVKPMFLSSFAAGDMRGEGLQSGNVKSYEMEFMEMAKTAELPMAGLETIEYQMSIFDSIPYQIQAEMLVESIKVGDTEDDQFAEMVKLYKAQDLAGMQEMFESEEGGLGEYEDVMLNNRNRNWIPIMKEMMADKSTFFAVGAGHLGGDVGVISLLKAEGYTLKPLRTENAE